MSYRFENLEVWKLARSFTNEIYTTSQAFPKTEMFCLTTQIRRASLSVLLNISEGSSRNSDQEFIRFLRIALSSAHEVAAALYIALDLSYIDKQCFDMLYSKSNFISKKINSLINYLRNGLLTSHA